LVFKSEDYGDQDKNQKDQEGLDGQRPPGGERIDHKGLEKGQRHPGSTFNIKTTALALNPTAHKHRLSQKLDLPGSSAIRPLQIRPSQPL